MLFFAMKNTGIPFNTITLKSLREIEITKVKVARVWMQDEKFHLFLSLSWGLFP